GDGLIEIGQEIVDAVARWLGNHGDIALGDRLGEILVELEIGVERDPIHGLERIVLRQRFRRACAATGGNSGKQNHSDGGKPTHSSPNPNNWRKSHPRIRRTHYIGFGATRGKTGQVVSTSRFLRTTYSPNLPNTLPCHLVGDRNSPRV